MNGSNKSSLLQPHLERDCGFIRNIDIFGLSVSLSCRRAALTVLWTLKSDREAISLSNSSVADVADGFAELDDKKKFNCFNKPAHFTVSSDLT